MNSWQKHLQKHRLAKVKQNTLNALWKFLISISGGSNMLDMPYFMENEEWYYYDSQERKFILTENAPQKAKESYKKFYEELNRGRTVKPE